MNYTITKLDGGLACELVSPSSILFTWYGDTVTELQVRDDDGRTVRLAVWNKNRRVIRSAYVETGEPANLAQISGLVTKCYGPRAYGHVEYFVGVRDE